MLCEFVTSVCTWFCPEPVQTIENEVELDWHSALMVVIAAAIMARFFFRDEGRAVDEYILRMRQERLLEKLVRRFENRQELDEDALEDIGYMFEQ